MISRLGQPVLEVEEESGWGGSVDCLWKFDDGVWLGTKKMDEA